MVYVPSPRESQFGPERSGFDSDFDFATLF